MGRRQQPAAARMTIFIFVSHAHSGIRAFTRDESGGNLPAEYAPWGRAAGGSTRYVGGDTDLVARAVLRDGYFLVSGHSKVSARSASQS
jgi:hypothetical protein